MTTTLEKTNLDEFERLLEESFTKSFQSNSLSLLKCDTVFRKKLFLGINYIVKPSKAHL